MRKRVAIAYNEPYRSRYDAVGEQEAVIGVLQAVEKVYAALVELGYDAIRVPMLPPLESAKEKIKSLDVNLVFNLFEGFCGYPETEALVPELCSEMGTPYTGCPAAVLKLALDKAGAKQIMQAAGITTPAFQLLDPHSLHTFQLAYPCIVKPRMEDASHGVTAQSVVNDFASLGKQVISVSHSYGGSALVEEFVAGREFNATVLGNSEYTVLPLSEIVYSLPPAMPRILTFAAKWQPDSPYFRGTTAVCPADIGVEEHGLLAQTAIAASRVLGCEGYARVDMRMDEKARVNVIEINPNPDISPGSGAVRQAEAAGLVYTQFIERIVGLAYQRTSR